MEDDMLAVATILHVCARRAGRYVVPPVGVGMSNVSGGIEAGALSGNRPMGSFRSLGPGLLEYLSVIRTLESDKT